MSDIKIRSAFVEDNKGFVLKIAEPHSKKNDHGGYDTVSRTFFDVKVRKDSGIDLSQFTKGQRVQLAGRLMTDVREYEGKKFYTLTIWADSVSLADAGDRSQGRPGSPVVSSGTNDEPWSTPGAQNASWPAESESPF